jgi:tripartite-type tricarboxylate transporter receptor subunit TctC
MPQFTFPNPCRGKVMRGLVIALFVVIASHIPAIALAAWPEKPIRLVVGFVPGGGVDVISRLLAADMTNTLGQQVIVENRPGASTRIAAASVARAEPDGYTIMMLSPTTVIANILHTKKSYRMLEDFTPIALVASSPLVVAVRGDAPYKTIADLINASKQKPDALNYGAGGTGTSMHLAWLMLQGNLGFHMTHVPYKGAGETNVALLAGDIDAHIATSGSVTDKGNRMRFLAVTTRARFAKLPQVPTISETVFPGFDVSAWYAVAGPANMPAEVVNKINAALRSALAQPEIAQRLIGLGATPTPSSPKEAGALFASEVARWQGIITSANMKADD